VGSVTDALNTELNATHAAKLGRRLGRPFLARSGRDLCRARLEGYNIRRGPSPSARQFRVHAAIRECQPCSWLRHKRPAAGEGAASGSNPAAKRGGKTRSDCHDRGCWHAAAAAARAAYNPSGGRWPGAVPGTPLSRMLCSRRKTTPSAAPAGTFSARSRRPREPCRVIQRRGRRMRHPHNPQRRAIRTAKHN